MSSNILPNLVDHARMENPDGLIGDIASLLAQSNNMLKDMVFQESNTALGHKVQANTGLPQGTWRAANQGVGATKPTFADYTFSIAELVDYSMVDKSIAELNGDTDKFRWQQDQTHIQGLGQQVQTAMLYSNEATQLQQFTGFFPYYNTLETATAQSAKNVINAGGAGGNNASILLTAWGNDSTFALYKKGSQAGLTYEDKGDVVPLYDTNGNRFEGYTSYFCWKLGLCLYNWQYNVRVSNIDVTTAGLKGTSPPDLYVLMSEAVTLLPTSTSRLSGITQVDSPTDPAPGTMPAFYMNRTVRTFLDIQAIRDKNVLIGAKDYAGEAIMTFRDTPIRVVDSMLTSEANVT